MNFEYSARAQTFRERLLAFFAEKIYPNERLIQQERQRARWDELPQIEELKRTAQAAGLWNLFLPQTYGGAALTTFEYAPLCEIMGRVEWASEVFNSSPPDSGNMEVLHHYGTDSQKAQWLVPLASGSIRSCFAMTEPAVASSDATNIATTITREGNEYVVNGLKWWITGAAHPKCTFAIVMGKTNPDAESHRQHGMIVVPMDLPGVKIERTLTTFGYDHAPGGHGEVRFENVRVPAANLLLGEGRGFEIAQGRLGPGRVHHCMRTIGVAERALEAMCQRVLRRTAFGRQLAEQGPIRSDIAQSRMEIEQARLLVLKTARLIDTVGAKAARAEIAMIKVVVPRMAQRVIDRAIQAHGAAGLSDDYPLASHFASVRSIRILDGPDEVHQETIAKLELRRHANHDDGGSHPKQ